MASLPVARGRVVVAVCLGLAAIFLVVPIGPATASHGGDHTVAVTVTGAGSVTDDKGRISCPATCSATYSAREGFTSVTLTATPAQGAAFAGWSGCSSTSGATCTLDLRYPSYSVTASFTAQAPAMRTLTVTVTGSGRVTSSPAGIDCPTTCSASFVSGTSVALTAVQGTLASWGGACSGSGGCTVTMDADKSVSAAFKKLVTLTVSVSGGGKVVSTPGGIDCPTACSAQFTEGTPVQLLAVPGESKVFAAWSGACSGTAKECTLTLAADGSAGAAFTATPVEIVVTETVAAADGPKLVAPKKAEIVVTETVAADDGHQLAAPKKVEIVVVETIGAKDGPKLSPRGG